MSGAREVHAMRLVKLFAIALVLAAVPTTIALVASAATPTTSKVTRILSDTVIPEAQCKKDLPVLPAGATDWKACHVKATETRTVATSSSLASALGMQITEAFDACAGTFWYDETIYIGPALIAQGFLEFDYCWGANDVQVTWGPACWTQGSIAYGTGDNFCIGPTSDTAYLPGLVQHSWYLFPYSLWWWHINSMQQDLLYPGWWSYSQCYNCN
jgi:hypothetical protein